MNALVDLRDSEQVLNEMMGAVRKESIERLQRGLPPEDAFAALVQGMSEMQDQTGQVVRMKDVQKEWKHIVGTFREGERFSSLQRTSKQERFGRFALPR